MALRPSALARQYSFTCIDVQRTDSTCSLNAALLAMNYNPIEAKAMWPELAREIFERRFPMVQRPPCGGRENVIGKVTEGRGLDASTPLSVIGERFPDMPTMCVDLHAPDFPDLTASAAPSSRSQKKA